MEPQQPIPTPSSEAPELTEEEIRRFAETGAVEPPSPVNDLTFSLSSRGGETQNSLASSITKALSFNKKLFVLQNTLISSEQAERFLAQAVTMGDSIDIQQTMTEAAMDTLDMKIRCDPSLMILDKSEVPLWRTKLSQLQIARLVSQYFGKRHDEKKTLPTYSIRGKPKRHFFALSLRPLSLNLSKTMFKFLRNSASPLPYPIQSSRYISQQ